MTALERLWAGWRSEYIESTTGGGADEGCVLCGIIGSGLSDDEAHVVWRSPLVVAVLNAYPYTSGHLMVLPVRHVGEADEVVGAERAALWDAVHAAVAALQRAYRPEGVNVGMNLGRAAGAGVPGHLHVHALPRWNGDTNFMTTVADARVLPEALSRSAEKLRAAWPA